MRYLQFLTYLLLSLTLTACNESNKVDRTDWDDTFYFGVIPIESEQRTIERYQRFVDYLSETLGRKVELVVPEDYAGVINGLAEKKLHFALLGPKSYVEASKKANTMTAVRVVHPDGQDSYKGVIITKSDSNLKNIADLQEKTWVFTDPNSTSGFLIPSVYFAAEAQIVPETYFSQIGFSGNHEKSILMVKNGEIDAASTNNIDLERDSGRSWVLEDFNIIWASQEIPHDMIAYRQDLPASFKQALTDAALNYKDKQGLNDMHILKFTPSKDEDYNFVRQLVVFKENMKK
ncbi:phosphonate ABC transporter substrate-binding protein [Candidatus Albibeggiatoa sp. nov. NOAA]|uniref:phosphonate ABC transporter substrate-binding protein n=1 Tax=Candidatus Albibeggiatoa sp. nov. NOAA TaxID=3162724 RepID=UPI0032FFC45E|nr:phosphonate ABC transporter substrate-binding protein [Thiotrichaceae bacterium]